MQSNNILLPLYVTKDEEQYQLFLEYRTNIDNVFKWVVSYVGTHGILYRKLDDDLDVIHTDFLKFCNDNNVKIKLIEK